MSDGDALLSCNDRKEGFSQIYVRALANRWGYVVSKPEYDRDSIDLIISARGDQRPQIGVQLKSTA